MRVYALSHVSDFELHRGLASLVAQDRTTTAMLLAHIAEFDARRLYLPAAYPSMYAYCVHELHLSEDAAYKRIQAARVARRFPAIFEAVADGRLHLSGAVLLTPHLTRENAEELLAAASRKTKSEIEELIATRFPRSEAFESVQTLPGSTMTPDAQLAPGPVEPECADFAGGRAGQLAPGQVEAPRSELSSGTAVQLAPGRVGSRAKVTPIAPGRFLLQLTVSRSMRDKLEHARNLLGHSDPGADATQVLDHALDALIEKLERRKFAATTRPRLSRRPGTGARHIPADVKRTVWERDGGQCTFVGESGRRCAARKHLEFDHIQPVARGGRASVAGIRLLCRAHNQFGAECTFGVEFMRRRREAASARRRQRVAAASRTHAKRAIAAVDEIVPPLRSLGFSADEARRAAALCEGMPDAPLEQRIRRALSYFHPRGRVSAWPRRWGEIGTSAGSNG